MWKKLFGEAGVKNAVTIFHQPSSAASSRILSLLKASAAPLPSETSSSDASKGKKAYTLEVVEAKPTSDQLRSILEFVGAEKMESVVDGAADVDDAQRRVRLDGGSLKRPLVVDWNAGKVISGEDEAAIKQFIEAQKSS